MPADKKNLAKRQLQINDSDLESLTDTACTLEHNPPILMSAKLGKQRFWTCRKIEHIKFKL